MVEVPRRTRAGSASAGDLLQLLRDGVPRTKAEIAALAGLSRSTVSSRVDILVGSGLVGPAGEAVSSGGRPPSRVAFLPRSRVVVGVDLGATHGIVAVTDLAGGILAHRRSALRIADGPEAVLGWVAETALALLEECGARPEELVAIGIGVPGPVEHSSGMPVSPPIMPGWDRFDIPARIRSAIDVPVFVDNDVNLLALGERATQWGGVDDLIFVKVSTGVGAGIVSGGALQRGARGSAGDLGHVRVPYSPDSPRDPGDARDLEDVASGPAIAAALSGRGGDAATSADVVEALRRGDRAAAVAVREAGRAVGEVLAGVVNLLNPSVLVVGGSIARTGDELIAGIREVVYGRSIPLATQELAIVTSRGGELAGVLGAAIMAVEAVLAPEAVESVLR